MPFLACFNKELYKIGESCSNFGVNDDTITAGDRLDMVIATTYAIGILLLPHRTAKIEGCPISLLNAIAIDGGFEG